MKNMKRLLVVAGVLLLFQSASALEGFLTYFTGSISVTRNGISVDVEIGMPIQPGDVIRTAEGATVVIALDSATDIKLRESTTLNIDEVAEDVRVSLLGGSIFSRIFGKLRGGYSVSTETVLAGVRGTEFFIAFGRKIDDRPDVWLCVNSGRVKVDVIETGESITVREGEGINILGGTKLTAPKRYRWTEELNWNTDPGMGMVEDRTDLDQAYSDLLDQDYD
jgi:ferric-dicitrate binding protein FerR (iron transport regulator)